MNIYIVICVVILGMRRDMEPYRLKAALCKVFTDPRRLMIINELWEGEKAVGDLAKTLELPQAVTSRLLAFLRERGVVIPRREGANVYYRLSNPKIVQACDLIHGVLINQIEENKELAERINHQVPEGAA